MKKRVLFTGEAGFLSTGFARFQKEVMIRLHKTGKFELAEMGSYAHASHPAIKDIPWKFYPVLPENEQEKQIYESHPSHAFGRYKIDAVLADFQPDVVLDCRDPWMLEHLLDNRFRGNYKLFICPTVDSAPQRSEWVEGIFKKADIVTTYSRYGKRVLEQDGVPVRAVTSPGIDLDFYKKMPDGEARDVFHLSNSLFIFGTVMRNQKRKLFPDLFDAYNRLRKKWAGKQRIKKIKEKAKSGKTLSKEEQQALRIYHSVLYCHTSWPDLGWDLPKYIKMFNLHRHAIFTYLCDSCSAVFANWFIPSDQKGMVLCRLCGKETAHMPNTHSSVDEETLVKVFNLFDVYIQLAICEGWGLPCVESKACGIPGLYQNYSAMEDHVENGGGLGIKIARPYHEPETAAIRSLPDISDLVAKMEKLAFDDKLREKLGNEARECCERMHRWDDTARQFEEILDEIEPLNRNVTWDKPPRLEVVAEQRPPQNISDQDFVIWCYVNLLRRAPDEKGFKDWLTSLANGKSRDEVEAYFRNLINQNNIFERIRYINSQKVRGIEVEQQEPVEEQSNLHGVLV